MGLRTATAHSTLLLMVRVNVFRTATAQQVLYVVLIMDVIRKLRFLSQPLQAMERQRGKESTLVE
jgi:hypothetical protein